MWPSSAAGEPLAVLPRGRDHNQCSPAQGHSQCNVTLQPRRKQGSGGIGTGKGSDEGRGGSSSESSSTSNSKGSSKGGGEGGGEGRGKGRTRAGCN